MAMVAAWRVAWAMEATEDQAWQGIREEAQPHTGAA